MNTDIVDELLQQWAAERPKMDVSALGVVVRIQMLAKLLTRRTARALKGHGLKHWEYDVLSVLRRQGAPFELPATEIASSALLTTGAMTTRIDGLQERGLVSRRKSREDARSILVRLTARGIEVVDHAIESRLEEANEVLANIPVAEQKRIADSLRELLVGIQGTE